MNDITLTLPAELLETIFNIVDCVLFMISCALKGALALWLICFTLWVACMALTVPYMTIKSILTKNK